MRVTPLPLPPRQWSLAPQCKCKHPPRWVPQLCHVKSFPGTTSGGMCLGVRERWSLRWLTKASLRGESSHDGGWWRWLVCLAPVPRLCPHTLHSHTRPRARAHTQTSSALSLRSLTVHCDAGDQVRCRLVLHANDQLVQLSSEPKVSAAGDSCSALFSHCLCPSLSSIKVTEIHIY
jgi:hypothetical protein